MFYDQTSVSSPVPKAALSRHHNGRTKLAGASGLNGSGKGRRLAELAQDQMMELSAACTSDGEDCLKKQIVAECQPPKLCKPRSPLVTDRASSERRAAATGEKGHVPEGRCHASSGTDFKSLTRFLSWGCSSS